MANRAARRDGNAAASAGPSANGVPCTTVAAAPGGKEESGRSPPDSAARGRPSWPASCTTRSSRSSARLFWYLR